MQLDVEWSDAKSHLPISHRLTAVPMTQKAAKEFIAKHHRHHRPSHGDVFRVACAVNGRVVGVMQVGRPVARAFDDGFTLEVTRVATDGTANVCSFLYGRAKRIAKELGYARLFTYTLPEEGGHSLRASGWTCEGTTATGDRAWLRSDGTRANDHPLSPKHRWVVSLAKQQDAEIHDAG